MKKPNKRERVREPQQAQKLSKSDLKAMQEVRNNDGCITIGEARHNARGLREWAEWYDRVAAVLRNKNLPEVIEWKRQTRLEDAERQPRQMRFFHRTSAKNAENILKRGFRDHPGSYVSQGVNITLDENEGAVGDTVLQIQLEVSKTMLNFCEIKEKGKPCREWCFPAASLNEGKIAIANRARGSARDTAI